MSSGRERSNDTAPPLADSLRPRGPVELTLSEEIQPRRTVLRACGEVDLMTAPELSSRLDAILRGREGEVVVDLCQATFLDSTGLSVLLNAARRLIRQSRRLVVVCGQGPVRQVIELARLEGVLNVTDRC